MSYNTLSKWGVQLLPIACPPHLDGLDGEIVQGQVEVPVSIKESGQGPILSIRHLEEVGEMHLCGSSLGFIATVACTIRRFFTMSATSTAVAHCALPFLTSSGTNGVNTVIIDRQQKVNQTRGEKLGMRDTHAQGKERWRCTDDERRTAVARPRKDVKHSSLEERPPPPLHLAYCSLADHIDPLTGGQRFRLRDVACNRKRFWVAHNREPLPNVRFGNLLVVESTSFTTCYARVL